MSNDVSRSKAAAGRAVSIARLEARSRKTWEELTRGWRDAWRQGR